MLEKISEEGELLIADLKEAYCVIEMTIRRQLAIRQADETIVVADRSKFDARALFSFAPLAGMQRIVTDGPPEPGISEACGNSGREDGYRSLRSERTTAGKPPPSMGPSTAAGAVL